MSQSAVVSSANIETTLGNVEADLYDDGELVLFAPGRLNIGLSSASTQILHDLLVKIKSGCGEEKNNSGECVAPVVISDGLSVKKAIEKEACGWGANVGKLVDGRIEVMRYYYDSRSSARNADKDHEIGQGGRVG